jgi:hypothetical protein
MPDAVTNELLFEIMKNVKADVASLRLDVGNQRRDGHAIRAANLD